MIIKRYQPNQLENNLYTESRAAKILEIAKDEVLGIVAINNTQAVVDLGNESVVLDKFQFLKLLGNDRKVKAKRLKSQRDNLRPNIFKVTNPDNNSRYSVECFEDKITCQCVDYHFLKKQNGSDKVACKHIYSVLGVLGFDSLKNYLKASEAYHQEPEYNALHMAQGRY